ncbi:predicted protein [Plenodomus lingam JN3]|uniref:Predicted protein n=1 Tax=Leptosphaeria maculans (strain JN3 / isolate v23.1.3 / race Av1-4-5-6-7-8) TaxID=985895 RepID=E5A5H9_LEPMJ|nr:predicted protein [Plenodomus lingam JN3]CBX98877.1 predicted protein [Plenodomus lingam JN3]
MENMSGCDCLHVQRACTFPHYRETKSYPQLITGFTTLIRWFGSRTSLYTVDDAKINISPYIFVEGGKLMKDGFPKSHPSISRIHTTFSNNYPVSLWIEAKRTKESGEYLLPSPHLSNSYQAPGSR